MNPVFLFGNLEWWSY